MGNGLQDRALLRSRTEVRVAYGLACDVELADRRLRVDLPVESGGGATGPSPGQLLRGQTQFRCKARTDLTVQDELMLRGFARLCPANQAIISALSDIRLNQTRNQEKARLFECTPLGRKNSHGLR